MILLHLLELPYTNFLDFTGANDAHTQINTQRIPPSTNLLSSLPSGRDIHVPPAPYKPQSLDEEQLIHMRAPPEDDEPLPGSDGEDSDEERTRVGSYGGTFAGEHSGSAYY